MERLAFVHERSDGALLFAEDERSGDFRARGRPVAGGLKREGGDEAHRELEATSALGFGAIPQIDEQRQLGFRVPAGDRDARPGERPELPRLLTMRVRWTWSARGVASPGRLIHVAGGEVDAHLFVHHRRCEAFEPT